jgi:hypothetical protein
MTIDNGRRYTAAFGALFLMVLLTVPAPAALACPSWPAQASRYLTNADLSDCGCGDLKILRNEIYARHGRIFKTDYLRNYFLDQPWYSPDPHNPEGTKGQNMFEEYNRGFILQYEKGRGCNPQ